jgi:hypothetical protein
MAYELYINGTDVSLIDEIMTLSDKEIQIPDTQILRKVDTIRVEEAFQAIRKAAYRL